VSITYTNAKGQTYFLHHGRTKTGAPTYYCSMKRDGQLADAIPEGFEIYETPNGQVFVRRIPPKFITDEEWQTVVDGMRTYASGQAYKIDVKSKSIVIYLADQDSDTLARMFRDYPTSLEHKERMMTVLRQQLHYSPRMQFVLTDEQRRSFWPQRYCFRGAIDDWISIGLPDTLSNVVKTYVKHLGKASYFDLSPYG
jgi:hypothetical protein